MNLGFNIYFLFAFHLFLLSVKVWAFYIFAKLLIIEEAPNAKTFMVIFKAFDMVIVLSTLFVIMMEFYFVINFFSDVQLFFYEYIAIADQILFTCLVVIYLKRESIKQR